MNGRAGWSALDRCAVTVSVNRTCELGRRDLSRCPVLDAWRTRPAQIHDRPTVFWITPGGGIEAALRELREETGIRPACLERNVAKRDILLRQGDEDMLFQTTFFLARTTTSDVSLHGLTAWELDDYRDHRWWSLEELDRTSETVFPEDLPSMLRGALDVA